jgi:protein-S-isoprenylcysteine O-methyltransferase Ste14
MVWHFRRLGKPSRAMLVTALLAIASTSLQIAALWRCAVRFPFVAFALYAISAALFWSAVAVTRGKLAACGQSYVSTEVVKEGPYRHIRHPFYAAYNLTWLAGYAATGWWPLAANAMLMGAVYERFARQEERSFLAGALAGEYREYQRQAGKYLHTGSLPLQ